uniref:Uncharacterized protein n=1 Tax=Stomoxys calcitrans TaxID=35570 RepID=A0A1I8Q0L7_STOCA
MVDAIFNGLVVGTSSYALSQLQPSESPFLYTACAMGLCHGLLSLYGNIMEGSSNSENAATYPGPSDSMVRRLQSLTESCVEIASVPLINMDFYLRSQQSSPLAMGHGLFVIPLMVDLSWQLFSGNQNENGTETLKELNTLGNIVSLVFLSVNEGNLAYGIMAVSALMAQYGPMIMENSLRGSGANTALIGYSLFFALIPAALSNGGQQAA